MALLESPYDIRGGTALDADIVPLGCLLIALLYPNIVLFDSPYDIRGGDDLDADSVPFSASL